MSSLHSSLRVICLYLVVVLLFVFASRQSRDNKHSWQTVGALKYYGNFILKMSIGNLRVRQTNVMHVIHRARVQKRHNKISRMLSCYVICLPPPNEIYVNK